MAHVQNGVNLVNLFQQNPKVAAIAASSFAGPLLGLWTHNGAHVPGYGRLLTSSEAHSIPDYGDVDAELPPSPNVLPIDIFGHPNTVMYSPAPPAIASSPQVSSPQITIDIPAIQSFEPVSNVTSPQYTKKSYDAVAWLVGAMGVVVVAGLVTAGKRAYKKECHKPMDSDTLVAFLQTEINKIKKENAKLKEESQDATSKVKHYQVFLQTSEQDSRKHREKSRIAETELQKFRRDVKKIQYELDDCKEKFKDAQDATTEANKITTVAGHARDQKQSELNRIQNEKRELQADHDVLTERFRQLQDISKSALDIANVEKESLSGDIVRQTDVISSLQARGKELQHASEEVERAHSTTKTQLEDLKAQHSTPANELAECRKALEEKSAILSELDIKETKIRKELDDDKKAFVKEQQVFIRQRDNTIRDLNGKIRRFEAKIRGLEDSRRAAINNKEELEKEVTKLKDNTSELETKISVLEKSSENAAQFKSKADADKAELDRLHKVIQGLEQELATQTAEHVSKKATELAAFRQQHEADIAKLKETYAMENTEKADRDQQREKAIKVLEQKLVTQTAEYESKMATELAALRQQRETDIKSVKKDLWQTHATGLAAFSQQHEKYTERLKETRATEIAEIKSEVVAGMAKRDRQLKHAKDVQKTHADELAARAEDIARLKSENTDLKSELQVERNKNQTHDNFEKLQQNKISEGKKEICRKDDDNTRLNSELLSLKSKLEKSDSKLHDRDVELRDKNVERLSLKRKLEDSDSKLRDRDVELRDKDVELLSLKSKLEDSDSKLCDKDVELRDKDAELRSEQMKVQNHENSARILRDKTEEAQREKIRMKQELNDEMTTNANLQHDFDEEVVQHEAASKVQQKQIDELQSELDKATSTISALKTQFEATLQEMGENYRIDLHLREITENQVREHFPQSKREVNEAEIQDKLEKSQSEAAERQKQHDPILAQKDREAASLSEDIGTVRQEVQDLSERLQIKDEELERVIKDLDALNMHLFCDDDTSRVTPDSGLNFAKKNWREHLKWTLWKGIVDRGFILPSQVFRLKLPHDDPFYSELPLPFPKPCKESDVGVKKKCDACGETYLKADYHEHGPACLMYFAAFAIRCPGCNGIFHRNDEYQVHEKLCKKFATPGPTPEVIKQMTYVREHDILAGHDLEVPKAPTPQVIMSLKASVLDLKSADTLYRAVLPYKDSDYMNCQIPFPKGLKAILPDRWPKDARTPDIFAGRKQCHFCKEWYVSTSFRAHFEACKTFFYGDSTGNSPPHARCEHCGDYFVDNKAYHDHKALCSDHPTAASCEHCGDIFTKEPIKFRDDTETVILGQLNEHMKYCHMNPHRHTVLDWMKKGLDAPPPPSDEETSSATDDTPTTPSKATTTTTTTTTPTTTGRKTSHPHPVKPLAPPRIATNGYQQPQPQPASPSSFLGGPYPSSSRAPPPPHFTRPPSFTTSSPLSGAAPSFPSPKSPALTSTSPIEALGHLSQPSSRPNSRAGSSRSRPTSQAGSPGSQPTSQAGSPLKQSGGGLSGSRHASQAGSAASSRPPSLAGRDNSSSAPSTPTPSPKKQGDGAAQMDAS